jgi:26S proteasome regulatory subunit N2
VHDTRITTSNSTTMVGLTSAAGIVGFLVEPDPALRSFALRRLNEEIDLLWPEVAGSVSQM